MRERQVGGIHTKQNKQLIRKIWTEVIQRLVATVTMDCSSYITQEYCVTFFLSRKISSFFEVLHLEFVWIFLILDHSLLLFRPVLASLSFFNCTKILLQGLFLWLRLLVKSHAYYNAGMCWLVFHLQDFQIHQIAQRSFREVINVVSCKIPSNLRTISKASHWGCKWLWEAANLICIEETYKDFSHNSLLMYSSLLCFTHFITLMNL